MYWLLLPVWFARATPLTPLVVEKWRREISNFNYLSVDVKKKYVFQYFRDVCAKFCLIRRTRSDVNTRFESWNIRTYLFTRTPQTIAPQNGKKCMCSLISYLLCMYEYIFSLHIFLMLFCDMCCRKGLCSFRFPAE